MHVSLGEWEVELDATAVDAPPETVRRQVREYDAGDRRTFDLDVTIPDSFTGAVMAALLEIPYGKTRTYGDLAATLDTAPVAVGQALARNPVPVVVPCHRVVGADSLGGYSAGEDGQRLKRYLLELEGADLAGR
jgi:methylated-DNA-[protein]-cysteine S-methyltransferase